jgi:PAS domain S-box-containing protein
MSDEMRETSMSGTVGSADVATNAAEALAGTRDMIVNLTNLVPGVVYQYRLYPDGSSAFPFSSRGMSDIYEFEPEDVRTDATPVFSRLHPDDCDRVASDIAESARTLEPFHCEFRVVLPRQGLRWRLSDALPQRTEDGGTLWYGIISDVTDRVLAEQALSESCSRLDLALQASGMGTWDFDIARGVRVFDEQACGLLGLDPDTFQGTADEFFRVVHADDLPALKTALASTIESDAPYRPEYRVVWPDGSVHWVAARGRLVCSPDGTPARITGIIADITEPKRAAESMRESEDQFRSLFERSIVAKAITRPNGEVVVNRAFSDMLGYTLEEIPDRTTYRQLTHPDDLAMSDREFNRLLAGEGSSTRFEKRYVRKDGEVVWVDLSSSLRRDEEGEPAYFITTMLDITQRKRAEAEHELTTMRVEALLQLNQMTEAPLQELTDFALEEAVELTQSTIGYLAFLNQDETVLTMHSWSKSAMGDCAIIDKPIEYPVETTGLWGEAVRQRRAVITNDYAAENPWKKGCPEGHVALHRHVSVPIFEGAQIVAVAGVGNKHEEYDHDDVRQLTLLMEGMWRLLERKGRSELLQQQKERIDRMLTSVIDVTSTIVETRDPYTAGHQRRVADIAVRIACDLGMSERQIDDIRVAALIHDVGKVQIPAEILGKPGAISPLEYEILKGHAEAGYHVVSSANMDVAIADMVHQHHERCDGSGYPRGLHGDQMLPGAKVLAVADVIEAMMSHRPYRAARGLDEALAEIEEGAGTRYDADVARACVALFREGRISIE